MDRFACYELCVQSPRHVSGFLRGVYLAGDVGRGEPVVLHEDFCGTATIARRWIADGKRLGVVRRAVGVDLDAEVLARARVGAEEEGVAGALRLVQGDVVGEVVRGTHPPVVAEPATSSPPASAGGRGGGGEGGADIIFVGNFSIGYIHDRAMLVGYLRRARERVASGASGWGGGVFVCDLYDSPGKYALGTLKRVHPGRGKEIVHYTWEHREADALTAMVTNAIHFRVVVDGDVVAEHTDAFIYRWRLWSIVEMREAMMEAGFAATEVYAEVSDTPRAMEDGSELPESGIVCVVGRT